VLSGVRGDLLDELNSTWPEYANRGKDGCVRRAEGVACSAFSFGNVWIRALATFWVQAAHFHDLRHTGNQFAADDGASLRELMERMRHASQRAAMIYPHISKGRSRHIADRLSARLREARPKTGDDAQGHSEGTPPLNEARQDGGVSRERALPCTRAVVETRGLEPLTPALQRQCSAS
jgi:hypothetical protein